MNPVQSMISAARLSTFGANWRYLPGRGLVAIASVVLSGSLATSSYAQTAGNMLHFDGSSDYVQIPDSNSLDLSTAATIEFWMYPDRINGHQRIVNKGDGQTCNSNRSYEIVMVNDAVWVDVFAGDAQCNGWAEVSTSLQSPVGRWIHVAATYDSAPGEFKLYVDGQLASSTTTTLAGSPIALPIFNSSLPLLIGGAPLLGPVQFQGAIDEVRVWNVARTGADIGQFFNRKIDPATPGLVGYWAFDEAVGEQQVFDQSPSNNTGTLGASTALESSDPSRVASTLQLQEASSQVCIVPGAMLHPPGVDQFGNSIALTANGNMAIIGAWAENGGLGAAHVYTRSGNSWTQQGPTLAPTGGVGAQPSFGSSVSISADGTTALVGAYFDNDGIGAAYVFTRTGNVWTQQGPKIVATGGIGALQWFGSSSALSADGNTAFIGAWEDNGQIGAAYVFVRSGGAWTQQVRLVPPVGTDAHYFGFSVSLSADGNTAATGAQRDSGDVGAAFVYTRHAGIWTQQGPRLTATGEVGMGSFGNAVSLSADGNTLLVGAYYDRRNVGDNGAAFVFARSGGVWAQQGPKLVPPSGAPRYFGYSVALSGDGNTAVAGASGVDGSPGAAYVFARVGNVWTQPGEELVVPLGGNFGNAAAFNADGTTAMIGAWNYNSVYVYALTREIVLTQQPAPVVTCPLNAATFSVAASGTAPSYRWQRETGPGTDAYVNLNNGSTASWDGDGGDAIVFGATTATLIIVPDQSNGRMLQQSLALRYRCVVSNSCGSATSDAASLTVCAADFDCDGTVDFFDYDSFVNCFEGIACPPSRTADFDGDGSVDFFDYDAFVVSFEAGC